MGSYLPRNLNLYGSGGDGGGRCGGGGSGGGVVDNKTRNFRLFHAKYSMALLCVDK